MSPDQRSALRQHVEFIERHRQRHAEEKQRLAKRYQVRADDSYPELGTKHAKIDADLLKWEINHPLRADPPFTPRDVSDDIQARFWRYEAARMAHNRRGIDHDDEDAKLREFYLETRRRALAYARFDPELDRRFGKHDDVLAGLDEILRWTMEVARDVEMIGRTPSVPYTLGPGREVHQGEAHADLSPNDFKILAKLRDDGGVSELPDLYHAVYRERYVEGAAALERVRKALERINTKAARDGLRFEVARRRGDVMVKTLPG